MQPVESQQPGPKAIPDHVLVAAARLFRERGYAASTTRELSTRLGINKASLYYHIAGKEDLLHQICVESLRRVHEAVSRAVAGESEPGDQIRVLIRTHLVAMLTDDLDLHATMLLELKSLTGERYEDVLRERDRYESLIARTVSRAQRSGALRSDIKARQLTLGLFNLLNWTLAWYRPDGKLTPDDLADLLSELYLNGAGPR